MMRRVYIFFQTNVPKVPHFDEKDPKAIETNRLLEVA
jgi:hypothetical protein